MPCLILSLFAESTTLSALNHDSPVYRISFKDHESRYYRCKAKLQGYFAGIDTSTAVYCNDANKEIAIHYYPGKFHMLVNIDALMEQQQKEETVRLLPELDMGENQSQSFKRVYALFDHNFMTPEFKSFYMAKLTNITEEFDQKYGNIKSQEHSFNHYERDVLQDKEAYNKTCQTLFEKSFGIGEYHTNDCAKKFLLDNMPNLKKADFKTIFLEGLCYELQGLLDEYLNSAPGTKMPILLDKALHSRTQEGFCLKVVEEAKKCGIRVVGIETNATAVSFIDLKMNEYEKNHLRVKVMNAEAIKIIDGEAKEQKFVIFCGSNHLKYSSDQNHECVGLKSILNIPGIMLHALDEREVADDDELIKLYNMFYIMSPSQYTKNDILERSTKTSLRSFAYNFYHFPNFDILIEAYTKKTSFRADVPQRT